VLQRHLEATIHRALELGVNHIETARGYGASERQLGQVLPGLRRDQIIVQTKIGVEDGRRFTADFEDSLSRLNLDHVDLLGLHGINTRQIHERVFAPGGAFEQAQKLREQGKCRFVGFSTHGPLDVILDTVRFGAPGVGQGLDYMNLHYYYIFQHNAPAIAEAAARDMGVFIISPSDKGGKLYAPPDRLASLCRPLHPMVFNDLWCLKRNPNVHTLSIGAARPTDFDLHVRALEYWDEADELLERAERKLDEAMAEAVDADLRDPWGTFAWWDRIPGGINVANIIWLLNMARAWGMIEYGRFRYNMMGSGGHWMPGCQADRLDDAEIAASFGACFADFPGGPDRLMGLLREAHAMFIGKPGKRLSTA
jgi:predicted aldo/keto reductase-like oxidoreductase